MWLLKPRWCWSLVTPQVKYTRIYLRDTTLIRPFPMLLFGGDIDIQHRERLITLDGWIHFQVSRQLHLSPHSLDFSHHLVLHCVITCCRLLFGSVWSSNTWGSWWTPCWRGSWRTPGWTWKVNWSSSLLNYYSNEWKGFLFFYIYVYI